MTSREPLVLRFDPQTVDHLGAKMYSHLPNAIAELVANAYDADAAKVMVRLHANGSISVEDDGHGMSRTQVADNYLHIGRNRRQATAAVTTESGKRHVSGKKGLGKLALFGIGHVVELSTTRQGSSSTTVVNLSYEEMMAAEGEYAPSESEEKADVGSHGTTVLLSSLKRKTAVDARELASGLARLFNYADSTFSVTVVSKNGTEYAVTADLRMALVAEEFSWTLPEALEETDAFLSTNKVRGKVIATKKPLLHGMRGITLYANGRLINEPEFFGASESSYAFSYLTGSIDVDFVDDLEQDVIATDRRAIDWGTAETESLKSALQRLMLRIGQEWRQLRSAARKARQEKDLGITTEEWVGSVRSSEQGPLRELVESLSSDSLDISPQQQGALLAQVKEIAPPNAEYVWRHLHAEIQAAAEKYYMDNDYFQAIQEGIKRYVTMAKNKAGLTDHEAMSIISQSFGDKGRIKVFDGYGSSGKFSDKTIENVENGQKHLSMGIIAGFRNPLAHEEILELHGQGAFTFQDCLDALSILSHLARRLEAAPKPV